MKLKKPTIICVDDESTVLVSLKEQLKRVFGDDYRIEVSESAEDALEIIQELNEEQVEIPLIISDQIMPGMKGDEFLVKVHQMKPSTLKILLTGQANAEAVGNIVNSGSLYRYISKPWEANDLQLTIKEALRRYSNELELNLKSENLAKNAEAFFRFVPNQFLELLGFTDSQYSEVQLGHSLEKDLTVLFSDIRGFTSLCELIPTDSIFTLLNEYLSHMAPIIYKHNGFIDSYIGDSIMALFHNPEEAMEASLEMLKALKVYNDKRIVESGIPIAIGIGINTGTLILGTIGEEKRIQTTVIGDTVNIAARIEGMTKDAGRSLLVSEHTVKLIKDSAKYQFKLVPQQDIRGKVEGIEIYEVGAERKS
ncbi:MAG: adenylate/guanylate cyclase domain-containing response regulator [Leptospira sp.]|jgi:adenylate cyclase|nr:adenylate/guanylate cyclase domain-containing response regulator [Leptospira sp.]